MKRFHISEGKDVYADPKVKGFTGSALMKWESFKGENQEETQKAGVTNVLRGCRDGMRFPRMCN